jgi:hypothetical protein
MLGPFNTRAAAEAIVSATEELAVERGVVSPFDAIFNVADVCRRLADDVARVVAARRRRRAQA